MFKNVLSTAKSLGYTTATLGEIVSREKPLTKKLDGVKTGEITVRAEEVITNNDMLTLDLSATKLDKKDFFGKSDPFFTLSKSNEDGTYTIVHRSEEIKVTLNPEWDRFTVSISDLCNGDLDREILIEVLDWNANGRHNFIGKCTTTARELEENRSFTWELINPKKQQKKGKKYRNSGELHLNFSQKERRYTFIEYLQGGMEMNFDIGRFLEGSYLACHKIDDT